MGGNGQRRGGQEVKIQRLLVPYPYPDMITDIHIVHISREIHRVATRSHRLQLRAVDSRVMCRLQSLILRLLVYGFESR